MSSTETREAIKTHRCPYTILGVERGASPRTIRRAFRRQALRCHPDKIRSGPHRDLKGATQGDGESLRAPEEGPGFLELVEAFEALATPQGRAAVESEQLSKNC